jgi:pimeloyl-ACP methyl ester carboxylesterase
MWRPQLGALAGRARLLAPDLPGCGLSPVLPWTLRSLEDYAGEVLDTLDALSRIRCPVVCLAGEEDAFTPPDLARATAERLSGGRSEIIPAAGHLTNLEAPEAFNDAVQALLVQASPV